MRSTVSPRRGTRVLYAGLVLFVTLTLFTARAVWLAWQDRSGQARADAIFDLVEERTPLRPTDTPGATAWLQLELGRYGRQIAAPDRAARFRAFGTAGNTVPDDLTSLLAAMRQGLAESSASEPIGIVKTLAAQAGSLREEAVMTSRGHNLVLTRRRNSGASDLSGDPFVRTTVSALAHATEQVAASLRTRRLPATPDDRTPYPVRLYTVWDDGTLVSAPWASDGTTNADARELALLSGRPQLPSFAPQEFFFRLPPQSDHAAWYSGFYLDLGGRGLVSTVMTPVEAQGHRGVVALDLAFDIDWSAFGRSVEGPVAGAAVAGLNAESASWASFDAKLGDDAPASLRAAVGALARGDLAASDPATPVRQGVAEGLGAVVAFRVADATWLLMLFPLTAPAFPVVPLVLMVGFLALLLSGFEINRRRAETERRNAEHAVTEAAARDAELRMLRAQMNPHFLFNSLNTVLAGLDRDPKSLTAVVQGLADYLRYSLAHRHTALVPLGEEFDAAASYLVVEKARFRDDLEFTTHIDEAARTAPVPGVMLQPLIENAMKHGYKTTAIPLRVRVDVRAGADGRITIEVANSGRWIEPPSERAAGDASGVGQESLKRRLALLYPEAHRFEVVSSADEVAVRIELHPLVMSPAPAA